MKKIAACIFLSATTITMQAQYIPKFDLQGHRGARGIQPENTIPAFLKALEHGVTTLELDVVITKDKQVLVSHEPFISPSICLDSNGQEFKGEMKFNIYQLTYKEITRFDCGSKVNERFPEQAKEPVNKPLLRDVIIAVENHIKNFTQYEVDYSIEVKSSPEGDGKNHPSVEEFSRLVFTEIDQHLPLQRVVIQSFDFRVLTYWHSTYPKVRLAALVENTKSIESNLQALGFVPSIYSPYFKLLSEQKIKYLKSLYVDHEDKATTKLRVIPWTVNEVEDMLKMKDMGVDGLITDYPNRAAEIGISLPKKQ